MNQSDNQSIIIEGGNEIALEDLNVQNADAIKGGPDGGGGGDIIIFDIVDSVSRRKQ